MRQLDRSGVDDNNERTRVDGRIERRQILRAEFVGDDDCEAPKGLILRVDEEPRAVLARVLSTVALLHLFSFFLSDLCPLSRVLSARKARHLAAPRGTG